MSDDEPIQLTLGVNLDDEAKFENFFLIEGNNPLLTELQSDFSMLYLWGSPGSGRTHLLQSLCHREAEAVQPAIYIPLADYENYSTAILEGLSTLNIICIDDVHAISGNTDWEIALFDFFNEAKQNHSRIVFSADCSPQELGITLRDLRSRLQSIPVFRIATMNDKQSIDALIFRAKRRGMELNAATAEFIYRRSNRSIDQLMGLLNKLDQVSLAEQRRLTIPLVKETMGW
ncbi:MAG: DnaA regulatory inactivator Hda [Gammaproteobacteria bacterium]|nr:DnaA regulatory inactivator Hda [Gammaproteobacteria bacterium]MDD9897331.1 DnaA regulatory inactivator Hda [Gammaproteobacteria bacterium]MDD9957715.1 DnaA regulatory inactivator Hda [Gammaproteobacteria bacterium]